jgi:hypothetical protein
VLLTFDEVDIFKIVLIGRVLGPEATDCGDGWRVVGVDFELLKVVKINISDQMTIFERKFSSRGQRGDSQNQIHNWGRGSNQTRFLCGPIKTYIWFVNVNWFLYGTSFFLDNLVGKGDLVGLGGT